MCAGAISVKYRNIDGMHIFTSPDVRGFYVASTDPREAFEEVSCGLQIILRLNENVDARVEPVMAVEDFLRLIGVGDARSSSPAVVDAARFKFSSRLAA
jgi:hypothetical protein